ncbi:peptidylprolyl isomerase [Mucilaginibacter sp. HMF5004]|uniref:peptidylprolyl isomerase n=1 Tax=Mucilaginibacter rivuli TaxID=2857527 RepID=UPI001C5D6CD2|nr:peptidylprolyl isomerase [Mucilaginibacter rivuli]MBW4890061.1 peptidylprolyl isomerase [Mucilaginibacter rivuli]
MKRIFTLILLLTVFSAVYAGGPKNQYVRIKTSYGICIIRLYNETPKHRDNFIKLAKSHFYDGTLFHRVIQDFMIQGGDPDSKGAKPGVELGNGGLKYKVDAEFRDSIFHKRGVLAAARDDNPEKASSSSQFYIVEGKRYTDSTLDKVEKLPRYAGMNYKIPASQREMYKTVGGTPQLDRLYTAYGEVVTGLDMVDRITAVRKDPRNRPLQDIPMTVELLSKRECKQLDKILGLQ